VNQIRKRLTYANVMSSLAVFLLLGGGAAFAATKLAKNSVGTKQLKNNAVTTKKIKNNAVTGAKVKESSLGTVPSATNFEGFVPFGIIAANSGETKTLVTYGPFSLVGQCVPNGLSLEAFVVFATTEEHSSFGGDDDSDGDVGPATPESERIIEDPGASSSGTPDNSDGYDDQFNAQAPSGRSWAGTVESWASKEAGQCRWSGYILKTS
jgi:hypothetical protein